MVLVWLFCARKDENFLCHINILPLFRTVFHGTINIEKILAWLNPRSATCYVGKFI